MFKQRINENSQISIILPTYNESENIIKILHSIGQILPKSVPTQAIVVDDNSPDGTGKLVEDYLKNVKKIAGYTIEIIHRKAKDGLGSAILKGIQQAKGDTIVVMDSDFSHPPQIILKLIESIKKYQYDIAVASRYIKGGIMLMVEDGFRPTGKNYIGVDELNSSPSLSTSCTFFQKISNRLFPEIKMEIVF